MRTFCQLFSKIVVFFIKIGPFSKFLACPRSFLLKIFFLPKKFLLFCFFVKIYKILYFFLKNIFFYITFFYFSKKNYFHNFFYKFFYFLKNFSTFNFIFRKIFYFVKNFIFSILFFKIFFMTHIYVSPVYSGLTQRRRERSTMQINFLSVKNFIFYLL